MVHSIAVVKENASAANRPRLEERGPEIHANRLILQGYEWWLMKEAKARNPDIKLYGLPWAYPGWVGNDPVTGKPSGSPFTYPNQTSRYVMEWVNGAKTE